MSGDAKVKLQRRLAFEKANWGGVLTVLNGTFGPSAAESTRRLQNFVARFLRLFNIFWFLRPKLSAADNQIAAALCQCEGADSVTLVRERTASFSALSLSYTQEVEFEPEFRRGAEGGELGRCRAKVVFQIGSWRQVYTRAWQVALLHTAVCIAALLVYVLAALLVVYGFAVFYVFLRNPVATTAAATRSAPIGLALVGFLVGMAAIVRRAVLRLRRDFGRVE